MPLATKMHRCTFVDTTDTAMLSDVSDSRDATVGDYDGDGHLDIFVANFADRQDPAYSGSMLSGSNYLYRNTGNGVAGQITFEKATVTTVTDPSDTSTLHAEFGDYDGDGFLDLAVSNFRTTFDLYRNDGNGELLQAPTCITCSFAT